MMDHLLLFARDPGATNQILAFRRLIAEGTPVDLEKTTSVLAKTLPLPPKSPAITILAKDNACVRLTSAGLPFVAWEDFITPLDSDINPVSVLRDKFQSDGITHVVTGVSDNDDKSHQKIWQAAKLAKIPCVTLLDDDTNLPARFLNEDGAVVWPDLIYAVSEKSRLTLLNLDIPASAIDVITNLHLSWILEQNSAENSRKARELRTKWGVGDNDLVVLFASQPVREMCDFGKPANFDEFACLTQLFEILNQNQIPSLVVIRPHPRDAPGKYNHLAGDGPPRTIISDEGIPVSAILAADSVAGMTSMLLQEAAVLSRPVIRLFGEGSSQ